MQFGEIVAPSIKELFIKRLEGMILSGELKAGDKLPTEREIADEMKISKTMVHEGIRELTRLGFLEVTSRKGVYVADYAQTGNLDTLLAIMRYQDGNLDKKTALSLLKVREYLECPSFEILALNHTEDDIRILEELQKKAAEAALENMDAFAESLFRYHRTVAFLSGNTLVPLIINAFVTPSLNVWKLYALKYSKERCLELLGQFTECIKNGDGTKASDLLRAELKEFAGTF